MACGLPRFARIDDRRPHLQRKSAVCGINGFLPRLAGSQWPPQSALLKVSKPLIRITRSALSLG
jgi:hypothetical protein